MSSLIKLSRINKINNNLIEKYCHGKIEAIEFDGLGDVYSTYAPRLLSYIKDPAYANTLNDNKCIAGVICKKKDAELINERIIKVICDDPNYAFFSIVNDRARDLFANHQTVTNNAIIPPNSYVADNGVILGRNITIEPNVIINPGVEIGDGSIIRSGAVLGLDTFQHQRHMGGIISPKHDGVLVVGKCVEIGANTCISKGFSYSPTIIKDHTKIDALTYIAHGSKIGESVIICAGARIMGHVTIENNCFIGPSATVTSRIKVGQSAKISIGSVVTQDVPQNERYTGNFAIPHKIWINFIKGIR